jgi:hypothetical protein
MPSDLVKSFGNEKLWAIEPVKLIAEAGEVVGDGFEVFV